MRRDLAWASLAAACFLAACVPGLPLPGPADPSLRTYRDTLLQLDLGYPEGWTFSEKKSFLPAGTSHDLYFEPLDMLWTRRYTVKVVIPDRIAPSRTVDTFKVEYLERLADRGVVLDGDDTAWSTLGGERAFRAAYTLYRDEKAFTRHADWLCRRNGRDVSLGFEVAEAHAEEDIVLNRSFVERFRFLAPSP
jgi:hypothetical protein